MISDFKEDVRKGLSANPKHLSSKYFYDEKGSELFQKIMQLPEYYLTDAELEIFQMQKHQLLQWVSRKGPVDVIELGAGDGMKTKVLLRHWLEEQVDFTYFPVDISADALENYLSDLKKTMPNLNTSGLCAEYFEAIQRFSSPNANQKLVLFLGSNIGNFTPSQTIDFLKELRNVLNPDDLILIGFDLKKHPQTILKAYNDGLGVTKMFNLNLLNRMNYELGANFELDKWDHYPLYDPISGEARSYLVSLTTQEVTFDKMDYSVTFDQWELIHTEISRKYDEKEIAMYAERGGFEVLENLKDCKHYFTDSLWRAK